MTATTTTAEAMAAWRQQLWWANALRRRKPPAWGLPRPVLVWDDETQRLEEVTVTEAEVLAALTELGHPVPPRTLRHWAEIGVLKSRKAGAGRTHRREYDDLAPWQAVAYRELVRAATPLRFTPPQVAEALDLATRLYPSPVDLDGCTIMEAGLRLRPGRLPESHPLTWVVDAVWQRVPGQQAWVPRDSLSPLAQRVRVYRAVFDRLVAGWPPETPLTVRFRRVGEGVYALEARPLGPGAAK